MSEKIIIPVVLFFMLSPTIFSFENVAIRTALFIPAYWIIARYIGTTLTKADLIVPSVLFLLLSPGVLLTIPPGKSGLFRSSETTFNAIIVHGLVMGAAFMVLRRQFPQYY